MPTEPTYAVSKEEGRTPIILTTPLTSAESTNEDIGPVHVDIDWNDTPHCALRVPKLPCLIGWDQNGTPTDLGDDTFYPYRSINYLGVDVDRIGPIDGTSWDYNPDEEYVGHHLIDLVDSVLKPLEDRFPSPIGDWTEYEQGSYYSGLRICLPISAPDVLGSTCWAVPVEAPFTDRNGTRLPKGLNHGGSDTDEFFDEAFEFLDLCWIRHLRYEQSPTCNLIPYRDELNRLYRRLTPSIVPGAALNETHLGVMDPQPIPARSGDQGPPGETHEPSTLWTAPAPLPTWTPEAHLPTHTTPAIPEQPAARANLLGGSLGAATETNALVPSPSASSWLPAAAAAAALLTLPLAWALYHRITRERVLLHASRRRLLAIIEQHPGIPLGEASKQLGLTYHTTAHHVRLLRRSGKIETVRAGRTIALYQVGAVPRNQLQPVAHLRRGPQADVLRLLHEAPDGVGVSELAGALGGAKSSTHAKLRNLTTQGLAERLPGGRYRATPAGRQALQLLVAQVKRPTPASNTQSPARQGFLGNP